MQLACEHFNANGYAVLPNFLNDEELKLLRQVQLLSRTCAAPLQVHTAKLVCCRSVMWLLSNPLNSWCSKAK